MSVAVLLWQRPSAMGDKQGQIVRRRVLLSLFPLTGPHVSLCSRFKVSVRHRMRRSGRVH